MGPELVSDIKSDEHVVFFNTSGYFNQDSQRWHLPIHGWIYEPETSWFRAGAIAAALKKKYGLTTSESTQDNFDERVNLLISDNERGKRIVIALAGHHYLLPASQKNGHFKAEVVLPLAEDIAKGHELIRYHAVTNVTDPRNFTGEVMLLSPNGRSIISDIDDTVKLSFVTDKKRLMDQTLLQDFEAVKGMADVYQQWQAGGGSVHFVSSSPWYLYSPLTEFLQSSNFPWATLSLKALRFRDRTLFKLFQPGTVTKPAAIEEILHAYPERTFVLVGDSGEQDPEVYADISRRYPEQIEKIYIRWISEPPIDTARFDRDFAGLDKAKWQVFTSPNEISL
ncbi:hypothetical protein GCM10025776_07010 [Corallincola platygyrae]